MCRETKGVRKMDKFKKVGTRDNASREKLAEIVPIDTPLTMHIELNSACNLKCKFCMHNNPDNRKILQGKGMELNVFRKLVNDLKQFPHQLNYISLHGRGESMINPHFVEMVKYIKEANVAKKIGLNTNATLLTPELSDNVIAAGIDLIRISVEGLSTEKYLEASGVAIDFDKFVSNIKYLYQHKNQCEIYIKIINLDLDDRDKNFFIQTFHDITDSLFIEDPVDLWKDAGLDNSIFKDLVWGKEDIQDVKICSRPFFDFSVHENGTVVACELDWKENNPIGNINDTSLVDIWNGNKMNQIRCMHLQNKENYFSQCKDCNTKKSTLKNDNIDSKADELYRYYSSRAAE